MAGARFLDLPPRRVTVHDPSGRHHRFRLATQAVRIGAEFYDGTVWIVCVRIGQVEHNVKPEWLFDELGNALPTELPCATILLFPNAEDRLRRRVAPFLCQIRRVE